MKRLPAEVDTNHHIDQPGQEDENQERPYPFPFALSSDGTYGLVKKLVEDFAEHELVEDACWLKVVYLSIRVQFVDVGNEAGDAEDVDYAQDDPEWAAVHVDGHGFCHQGEPKNNVGLDRTSR